MYYFIMCYECIFFIMVQYYCIILHLFVMFFCFFGNKKAVKYPHRYKVLIYCYLVISINMAMSWDLFV